MRHPSGTDRWEEGLLILARLIAGRIQAAAAEGSQGSASSEADDRTHDASATETGTEQEEG